MRLCRRIFGGGIGCLRLGRAFGVEGFEDSSAEALLELEQDSDSGEVDASFPGQVACANCDGSVRVWESAEGFG